jgi:hypothetical protein
MSAGSAAPILDGYSGIAEHAAFLEGIVAAFAKVDEANRSAWPKTAWANAVGIQDSLAIRKKVRLILVVNMFHDI